MGRIRGLLGRWGAVRLCAVGLPGLLGVVAGIAPALGGVTGTTPPYTVPYPLPTTTTTVTVPPTTTVPKGNPLAGKAMWIWELPESSGGSLPAIVARAHADGVKTVFVKSSDGSSPWSQFTPDLVDYFHDAHIKVCAWQYVYGTHPLAEAAVGARAVRDGADCLIIDAEAEYEGKYVPAQQYITRLRKLIGQKYPVALAGFPYVDYHPSFPYSIFLGPGGAQYNVPQMYWKDIGTTPAAVFAHTYTDNVIYKRPIIPLGQLYDSPPLTQVTRFRQLATAYGAAGVNWWDWQSASLKDFHAIAQRVSRLTGVRPDKTPITIGPKDQGDLVVWAQEHLIAAGYKIAIDGDFGSRTRTAVARFQSARGLEVTGYVDAPTWAALLKVTPVKVRWVKRGKKQVAVASGASGASGGTVTATVPASASLPDRGHDVPSGLGAGGSPR